AQAARGAPEVRAAPRARASARAAARWRWSPARSRARLVLRRPRGARAALRSEAARPFRLEQGLVAAGEDLVEEGYERGLVARQLGADRQIVAGVIGAEATGGEDALGHDRAKLAQELELARQREL